MVINYKRIFAITAATAVFLSFAVRGSADSTAENINPQSQVSLEQNVSETAEKEAPAKESRLEEVGFFTGFGSGKLKDSQGNYERVNFSGRFGYDISDKFNLNKGEKVLLNIEPSLNLITKPDNNFEAGVSCLLMYRKQISKKVDAYLEGGLGIRYTSQETCEQGTQLNSVLEAGFGWYIYPNDSKDSAITLGIRGTHLSNGGTYQPNRGINTLSVIVGYSKMFGASKTPRRYSSRTF